LAGRPFDREVGRPFGPLDLSNRRLGCFISRIPRGNEQALWRRQNRVVYDAFSMLFDWLKTLFTLLPNVGRIAMAARARKTSNRAYSTRSCPSSSRMNFLSSSIMVLSPFVWIMILLAFFGWHLVDNHPRSQNPRDEGDSKQAYGKPMVSQILTDSPLLIFTVTVATD